MKPVKFAVVTAQRTGSTLVITTLDAHPSISAHGEVFKLKSPEGKHPIRGEWGYLFWIRQAPVSRWIGHYLFRSINTRRYLDRLFEEDASPVVGFKIMLNQLGRFPGVLDYLVENQFRIIHVVRRNYLKTYLSRMTARARGAYHSEKALKTTKVAINVDTLRAKLTRIKRDHETWHDLLHDKLPYMEFVYEDFLADPEGQLRRVFDFVGQDYVPVQSNLVKVNPDSLSEIIENYAAVAAELSGTEFEVCLRG